MNDAGNGWRAGILTKVADQLLDQLAVERKSNLELRDLGTRLTEPPTEMSARSRLALAAAAALIAFVVPLALARLSSPPPTSYVVPWVPLAPLAAVPPPPAEPPLRAGQLSIDGDGERLTVSAGVQSRAR